jgi:hypothetical protein
MSRKNKVNPDHYKVAGRLAPDDLARERMKQGMAKTARDWDERTKESPASKTQMKSSAPGTKRNPVSGRSAATKPARRAAAGKKTLGSKKTSRRTPATR